MSALPLHDTWSKAGAIWSEGNPVPQHFGDWQAEYRRALAGRAVFDASTRGTLEVVGAEALAFLHNLATNDIKGLAPGRTCEAFLTTLKAKIIAQVWVTRLPREGDPVLWLDMEPGMNEVVFKHLDRHLISERVELTDRTAEIGRLRVFHREGESLPTTASVFPVVGFGLPVTDIVVPVADLAGTWGALQALGFLPMGADAYDVLRIEAGLPRMGQEMDETRFVVELDRTLQAICYTKGCYLGQEPIVMARDRGQVNRQLRGLNFDFAELPGVGTPLFRGDAEVGKITSVAHSPRLGHGIALAYLRRGHWDAGTEVYLEKNASDRPLRVATLPLAV